MGFTVHDSVTNELPV